VAIDARISEVGIGGVVRMHLNRNTCDPWHEGLVVILKLRYRDLLIDWVLY